MQTQTVLLIIAALIFALGVAVFHYNRSKTSMKLRIVLTFLRFVAVFSGLLLLINPQFSRNTYRNEKANLILLVDGSSSISEFNEEGEVLEMIKALSNNDDVQDRFSIHSYTFSKGLGVKL